MSTPFLVATACLRTFDGDANETASACLYGMPKSLGGPDPDGFRSAGLILSAGPDGAVMVDSRSVEWWDQLITEAMRARDELVYGGARLTPALNGGAR